MKFKYRAEISALAFSLFFFNVITAQNFSHPLWSVQSNIYEVNLRQYTPEGTFNAFEKHLPRLKNMGVEILWFMPITPIGIEGRKWTGADLGSYYAVKNYEAVNEEFGTMEDWKLLVNHAHAMGFKVIIDWVANHSSPDNHWINKHPGFYLKNKAGDIIPSDPDWTDTRAFNYANRELRDSITDAMKFWIKTSDIDGFRCDMAKEVPTDFWKQCITELRKVKNVFMLGEGEKPELNSAGFDATYTWAVMHAMKDLYDMKSTLGQFDSLINYSIKLFPKKAYRMYFTSNHDENSWNGTEFEKYGDAYKAFAVFTQTIYQSIPLIYSGQEVHNKKRLKFFVKDTIQWDQYEVAPFYQTLLKLRKSTPALAADASYKKIVTANDVAVFAYLREKAGHKVVVVLNLSRQPQKFTIKDSSVYGVPVNVFLGAKERLSREHVYSIEPWGYIVYDYDR
ncbi:MAG: alpha-amylase family glycosyl hydrolase [Ginsengibacter sp.]